MLFALVVVVAAEVEMSGVSVLILRYTSVGIALIGYDDKLDDENDEIYYLMTVSQPITSVTLDLITQCGAVIG